MQVLILGYGEMGHAMETLLGPRHELAIWEKYPKDNGFRSARLEEAVPRADCVVFCLPVSPHREVLELIRPDLKAGCLCLSIAKGLDENGHTACEIFRDLLGDDGAYALLCGPMIAEGIRAGRTGFAQAGCGTRALFERVEELFRASSLYLSHTTDLHGISWGAVLKNVYAMAFGIIDELETGDNMRGFLMVQALQELDRVMVGLGGRPGTAYGLAGLGDLATTATSTDSHHHALGGRLARGETENIAGEGVHTLAMIEAHRVVDKARYPLLAVIDAIVKDPPGAADRLHGYVESCFPPGTANEIIR